jgi:hypothetical protein
MCVYEKTEEKKTLVARARIRNIKKRKPNRQFTVCANAKKKEKVKNEEEDNQ